MLILLVLCRSKYIHRAFIMGYLRVTERLLSIVELSCRPFRRLSIHAYATSGWGSSPPARPSSSQSCPTAAAVLSPRAAILAAVNAHAHEPSAVHADAQSSLTTAGSSYAKPAQCGRQLIVSGPVTGEDCTFGLVADTRQGVWGTFLTACPAVIRLCAFMVVICYCMQFGADETLAWAL